MLVEVLLQAALVGAFFVPWTTFHLQSPWPFRSPSQLTFASRSSRHPEKLYHRSTIFDAHRRFPLNPYVFAHVPFTRIDDWGLHRGFNLTREVAESRKYWFPLFSIIRFANGPCTGPAGQQGVCYTLRDCLRRRGSAFSSCAAGYGVCCSLSTSCGGTVVTNNGFFVSPSYQGIESRPVNSTCTATVNKPPNVCQIRLDFVEFDLASPDMGTCRDEWFNVRGQNINFKVPTICGKNTGQHMYIDMDMSAGPLFLDVRTESSRNARWNIRITQIPCSQRAPANCLQYFTDIEGNFSSFNYYNAEGVPPQQGYMNNVDYTICIRRDAGYCSTAFFVNDLSPFIIQNVNADSTPTTLETEAGLGVIECSQDYLLIGGVRYCGTRLNPDMGPVNPRVNAPVVDASSGPVSVRFVSDSELNARGFEINYRQNPC